MGIGPYRELVRMPMRVLGQLVALRLWELREQARAVRRRIGNKKVMGVVDMSRVDDV